MTNKAKGLKSRYHKRRKKGLCVVCGRPAKGSRCVIHAKKAAVRYNKRRKERISKKLCVVCNKPTTTHERCDKCTKIEYDSRTKARREFKRLVLSKYSGNGKASCYCCGEKELDFLTIDHIKGGGDKHRKSVGCTRGGHAFYKWLAKNGFPKGFRTACHNCNQAAKLHKGTCTHKLR